MLNQSELSQASAGVQRRVAGLSLEQTQRVPAPGKWSRQQVLQHLMLAYTGTTLELRRRLETGTTTQRKPSLKHRAAQFLMLRIGKFPNGFEAPDIVRPERSDVPPMNGDSLAAVYNAQIEELAASIEACAARWGTSRRIAVHPVIGPMSAAQWTAFHALHTRHHTRQLDRITKASSA
jgi:hypothetical protein